MTLQLVPLLNAIAALSVSGVTGVGPGSLLDDYQSQTLPKRFVIPAVRDDATVGDAFQYLSVGSANVYSEFTWHIDDVCLFQQLPASGLAAILATMLDYAESYAQVIANTPALFTSGDVFETTSPSILIASYPWPHTSELRYRAVVARWRIKEYFNS